MTQSSLKQATNLKSFTTFINSIRRVYLDINHHSTTTTTTTTTRSSLDLSKGLITAWEGVRSLTDRERDEIDLEVKAGLRRSLDRVRELEAAEKRKSFHSHCQTISNNNKKK
jgi:syntaxin 18